MPRILYVVASNGGITGGQKMLIRHVETLRDLGFDAYGYIAVKEPGGLQHRAPLIQGRIAPDDIVVAPDDAVDIQNQCAGGAWTSVIVAQNPYFMAAAGLAGIDRLAARPPLRFLTVAPGLAATLRRLYPEAVVEVARAFADERVFGPAQARSRAIALTPRKRPQEAAAIATLFRRLHPQHADFEWRQVVNASEADTARAFAESEVFLSLSRLESLGITPLEAMAAGCVCAGFTGVGGQEFATPENGFWVPDDDCEAAADALAAACALVREGGAPLARMREAARETAAAWSHAEFRRELEAAWMRLAPQARLSQGPLD